MDHVGLERAAPSQLPADRAHSFLATLVIRASCNRFSGRSHSAASPPRIRLQNPQTRQNRADRALIDTLARTIAPAVPIIPRCLHECNLTVLTKRRTGRAEHASAESEETQGNDFFTQPSRDSPAVDADIRGSVSCRASLGKRRPVGPSTIRTPTRQASKRPRHSRKSAVQLRLEELYRRDNRPLPNYMQPAGSQATTAQQPQQQQPQQQRPAQQPVTVQYQTPTQYQSPAQYHTPSQTSAQYVAPQQPQVVRPTASQGTVRSAAFRLLREPGQDNARHATELECAPSHRGSNR